MAIVLAASLLAGATWPRRSPVLAIVLWQAVFAGAQTVGITPAPAFTATDLTAPAGANWLEVHGNLAAWDYSSLNQITTSNVSGTRVTLPASIFAAGTSFATVGSERLRT